MKQKTLGQMIASASMAVIVALFDTAKVMLKIVAKNPLHSDEKNPGDVYRKKHDRLTSSGLLDRYGNFKE